MLEKILKELEPAQAALVAVSKTKSVAEILEMYKRGQRIFGENRVQEIVEKHELLPPDIQWHFIGHLQRNKVKYIAPFIRMIHSVDSLKILGEIDRQAARFQRSIDCLFQFRIAEEDTKYGMDLEEARLLLRSEEFRSMHHLRIVGVMGMATFTEDEAQIRQEFRLLKSIFEALREEFFHGRPWFREISMGMSGDYQIALEEGSTMVRIGSLLFGQRE